MKLDDVDIPGGDIDDVTFAKKMVEHQYDRSDVNHVTEMGRGITRLRISGQCGTVAERTALAAKCDQTGTKRLYYPSEIDGTEDDRYYVVYTSGLRMRPRTATVYDVEFDALAADPIPYVTAPAAHVWS